MKNLVVLVLLNLFSHALLSQIVTYTPTSLVGVAASNVSAGNLARGTGITAPGSPCSGSWYQAVNFGTGSGGGFVGNTSASDAYDDSDYWTFTVTPNASYKLDISAVSVTGSRISGTGPASLEWAYQIGSGAVNFQGAATGPGTGNCASTGNTATWDISDFSTTQPVTFYLIGYGSTNEGGLLRLGTITLSGTVSLPIELVSFTGNARQNKSELAWSTATERDNAYFSVERGASASRFEEIGQVKGSGDSNGPRDYTFTDAHPLPGKNYYRLRQVDFDGKYAYSKVVTVNFGSNGGLTLSPMPAGDQWRVELDKPGAEDGVWQVVDMNGRVVRAGVFPAETVDYHLNIGDLAEGVYVFRLVVGQAMMAKKFYSGK